MGKTDQNLRDAIKSIESDINLSLQEKADAMTERFRQEGGAFAKMTVTTAGGHLRVSLPKRQENRHRG